MTATQEIGLRLDLARTNFAILKTPALRREVRQLELQLAQARHAFRTTTNPRSGKRRRGARTVGLVG